MLSEACALEAHVKCPLGNLTFNTQHSTLFNYAFVILHILQCDTEAVAEDSLTGIETILSLLDVVCMWIIIYIVCNLVDTWQWVHDLHVLLCLAEHVALQDIHVLHTLVLHQVAETLLLYTGHVENIGAGNHILVEILVLHVLDVVLLAVEFVLDRKSVV